MFTLRFAVVAALVVATPAGANNIPVNQFDDPQMIDGLCSLREALFAATLNAPIDGCPAGSAGFDAVLLGAGTYALRAAITLSASEPFVVVGAGTGVTTIAPEPGNQHRLFSLHNGSWARFADLGLRDGDAWRSASLEHGGAIRAVDSHLELLRARLESNRASAGGALSFQALAAPHELVIEDCAFVDNLATEPTDAVGADGGAVWVELEVGGATARITRTQFSGNLATGTDDFEVGGGALDLRLGGGTAAELSRSLVQYNGASAAGSGSAVGAVSAEIEPGASLALVDDVFRSNWASGSGDENTTAFGVHAYGGRLEVDRTRFSGEDAGEANRHVSLFTGGAAELWLTNLLIADGPEVGLYVGLSTGASARLGHLTVTGHGATGLELVAWGASWLENSILWQNGVDLSVGGNVPPTQTANLIGVDPHFTNPAAGDYSLAADSPALDTGNDGVATLRLADLLHAGRRRGVHTDRGALERGGLFADDFESADSWAWSHTQR